MPVRAGGRHLQEEAVWPQLLFLPTILYPLLSLQSLGRFCQAAVSLVGAPPVYVQCISRILVGQGDHGTPHHHNMPGHSLGQINQLSIPKKSLGQINRLLGNDISNHSE